MRSPVTLQNCDQEPIHIPGAIQPHGVLLAFRDGAVVQSSTNAGELFERADLAHAQLIDLFRGVPLAIREALVGTAPLRELNPLALETTSGHAVEAVAHRSGDLLVLEIERRRESAGSGFDPRLRQAILSLQAATDVSTLTRIAAEQIRALTGFDRVMVYRFDAAYNGEVVAESKREDLEPFLGLHYPASDIPAQARRLYTRNWLRHIADVAYTPTPIEPELDPASGGPLDLSHAYLRSVSPIHIEYLKNMGVKASMSVSLISGGALVGLIACHHYAGPRLLDFALREVSEYLGQALSWHLNVLERADDAERVREIHVFEAEVARSLAGSEDLLDALAIPAFVSLTGAAGAAIVLDEGVRLVGQTPDEHRVTELVAWLRSQNRDVVATEELASEYPPATAWDGDAAGLLATTLSHDVGEYLLWFRPSTERTVDWAGDPRHDKAQPSEGMPARLSPRGSFALWRETVRGRSLPWQPWHVEAASSIRRLMIGGVRRRAAHLRTLNTRLVEADRAKDVFIATVSHELRTPLNAITGWSRLALSGRLAEERRADAMQVISRNADALSSLVDDLLDVSRIVGGKLTLEVSNIDVGAIVDAEVMGMSLAAEAKGLRFSTVLESSATTVLGDESRVRQIVGNLLSNAVKFTPKGGSVTVSLGREGSDVVLTVRDTGPGIAASSLPHVFDAFWQADDAPKRRSGGLGLGLAIARRLTELHGGRISVGSEGLGQGTTFQVRLPIASTAASRSESSRLSFTSSEALAGLHIVVAEDEADSRDLLRQILESAGARVRVASSADEALGLILDGGCDILVSDIGMPGKDGFELITELRAKRGLPVSRVPAIALTAYTRGSDRTAVLRAGFQAHVPKPSDSEELITVISSLVGRL